MTEERAGKHTPGPWSYRSREYDDWGMVRGPAGEPIAQASINGVGPGGEDAKQAFLNEHRRAKTDPVEANARLIAAAPELLDALQGFFRAKEEFHDGEGFLHYEAYLFLCKGGPGRDAQDAMRAAIAKALSLSSTPEGETGRG